MSPTNKMLSDFGFLCDSQLVKIEIDSEAQKNIEFLFFLDHKFQFELNAIDPVLISISRSIDDDGSYFVGELSIQKVQLPNVIRLNNFFTSGEIANLKHQSREEFYWISIDGGISVNIVCADVKYREIGDRSRPN
jgi:hypothetical protein